MFLKVAGGLALGALYMSYYPTGDTWAYFSEATELADLARTDISSYWSALMDDKGRPLELNFSRQPRALFFVKLMSIVCLLANDNYWFASIYFSLFSFSGLWVLANVFIKINNNKSAAILAFILFPSVLFWSSGILKESVSVGALAFLTASLIQYTYRLKRFNIFYFILDILLIYLLWKTKYYYAAVFFLVVTPVGVTFLIKQLLPKLFEKTIAQVALFFLVGVVALIGITSLHPNFYFSRIIEVIVDNHNEIVISSESHNIIHFNNLTPSLLDVLKNVPLAFVSGVFRPFIGESMELFKILVGLENLFLLGLLVSAFFSIPKNISEETKIYLIAVVIYIIILSTMLALSTPNFGTLIRYKVGFLPYFVYLISVENRAFKWLNHKLF